MTEMKDDAFHDAHREQRLILCRSGLFPYHHDILKKIKAILKRASFYKKSFYFYGMSFLKKNLPANSTAGHSLL